MPSWRPAHHALRPLSDLARARFAILFLAIALAGCGTVEKDRTSKWTAERLYSEARGELLQGNCTTAREMFGKLESRYPFGRYAQQSLMESAYCNYKEGETADALSATDRFLKMAPNHPNVDYVYYLRGLVNFIDRPALLGTLVNYQVSERDPKALRESFEAFKELVVRFPGSRYAPDATRRLMFLRDALADHDTRVADYYYRRGAYLAAIDRAQVVVREYQGAESVERALALMVRSYDKLGMASLHDDALRILRQNFPETTALN
jgi:outer membrane protein assembly factor BamD